MHRLYLGVFFCIVVPSSSCVVKSFWSCSDCLCASMQLLILGTVLVVCSRPFKYGWSRNRYRGSRTQEPLMWHESSGMTWRRHFCRTLWQSFNSCFRQVLQEDFHHGLVLQPMSFKLLLQPLNVAILDGLLLLLSLEIETSPSTFVVLPSTKVSFH